MIDRVRRCLAAHQIPSRPAYAATGPRLQVWALELPAAAMARALRLQTAMSAALDREGVALRQRGRLLLVEVPRARGQTVDLEAIGPALGVTATGQRVGISLDRTRPHAIVAGMTGSGKSELLRTLALIESRRADTDLVLIDLKGGAFDELAERGHHVATDGPGALAALRWATSRIGADPDGRRCVVIVDEAVLVGEAGRRELLDIAERGRGFRVHLVLATQYVSAEVLSRRITTSADWRICGRVFDVTASRLVLNQAGAERLTGQGDMLISKGGAPAARFQAALAGPGAWQHARTVEPLELEPGTDKDSLSVAGEGGDMVAWAAETGASARAIRLRFGIGQDKARAIRDRAAGMTDQSEKPAGVIRPDWATLRSVSQGA